MRSWLATVCLSIALAIAPGTGTAAPAAAASVARSEVPAMLERAWQIRSSQPEELEHLLRVLGQAPLSEQQGEQLAYLKGYRMAYLSDFDGAIAQLKALRDSGNDRGLRLRAGTTLVNIYSKKRQVSDALRLLNQIKLEAAGIDNDDLEIGVLTESAYLHETIGKYEQSLSDALAVKQYELSDRDACLSDGLKFAALLKLGRMPEQDDDIQGAIERCEQAREPVLSNYIRTLLARKWMDEKKRDQAIALLTSHLHAIEATNYAFLITEAKSLLSMLLVQKGQWTEAETYATEAIAQGAALHSSRAMVDSYQSLYQVALARRDNEQALVYYRRYADADRAYLDEVKARELAFQMVQHESAQNADRLRQLDSQNQLLRLQQKLDRQSSQNSRLMVVLLVILLSGLGVWAFRTQRLQSALRSLAQTDALTGISNRHHFTSQAELALAQAAAANEPVALVMFDLDGFKSINDRFGHAVGDWALQQVSRDCLPLCRGGDVFGRLGGEEFAFLLRRCEPAAAMAIAEECRRVLADIDTSPSGQRFRVTASFGVMASCEAGYTLSRLLSQADRMLYRAKHDGRNRVVGTRLREEPLAAHPDRAIEVLPAFDAGIEAEPPSRSQIVL
ncbi:GGDEF domain-containing protein [Pseudoxanthomonas dokdonensis]|uniref:diguanylate cyclase n=1 Tax=Pseudoxanthomonas dokdonensis TaxID=344882 RepID=A0A0R0CGC1_9GAMM|nr:GGDEF domain-containing protein [Pseudoxanthomonas dokdonensis]KRG68799.1 hypothetical protein ABB29_09915 [Pseudoxanthomonas dokdonensis]